MKYPMIAIKKIMNKYKSIENKTQIDENNIAITLLSEELTNIDR